METNSKPLYKVLNEKRLNDNWKGYADATKEDGGYTATIMSDGHTWTTTIMCYMFGHTKEQSEANAQYTALAVNNLASMAEALENFINWADESNMSKLSLYDRGVISKAKEVLKRIS